MKLEETLQHFSLSEEERKQINERDDKKLWKKEDVLNDRESTVPDSFQTVARCILSGHFEVKVGNDVVRKVYPTCVEIYYHEEGEMENLIKDYIVYHRNKSAKGKKPASRPERFDIGNLHAHQSGIDITFEHEAEINGISVCVRSSALIRAFRVQEKGPDYKVGTVDIKADKEDTRSTYLYNALFSNLPLFKGFTILWVDDEDQKGKLLNTYRQNVLPYNCKGDDAEKVTDKKVKTDGRCWQFYFQKDEQ